jgi:hypothetical protein
MSKGLKRSQVVKKIKQIAQKWENSKIDTNCADTILIALESMGIICPPECVVARAKTIGSKKTQPVYGMAWAPEKKTKVPVKYFVPLKK